MSQRNKRYELMPWLSSRHQVFQLTQLRTMSGCEMLDNAAKLVDQQPLEERLVVDLKAIGFDIESLKSRFQLNFNNERSIMTNEVIASVKANEIDVKNKMNLDTDHEFRNLIDGVIGNSNSSNWWPDGVPLVDKNETKINIDKINHNHNHNNNINNNNNNNNNNSNLVYFDFDSRPIESQNQNSTITSTSGLPNFYESVYNQPLVTIATSNLQISQHQQLHTLTVMDPVPIGFSCPEHYGMANSSMIMTGNVKSVTGDANRYCKIAPRPYNVGCNVATVGLIDSAGLPITKRRKRKQDLGEKPISCTRCGKLFRTEGHLKTHFVVHTLAEAGKPGPSRCPVCNKSFCHGGALTLHMRSHATKRSADFACVSY